MIYMIFFTGHYIPAATERIHRGNKEKHGFHLNLKGFAIGNELTNPGIWYSTYADYAYNMGLIGEKAYKGISKIYPVCELTAKLCGAHGIITCIASLMVFNSIFTSILLLAGDIKYYDIRKKCEGSLCYDFSNMEKFLNQKSVKHAVDVGDRKFVSCNPLVYDALLVDLMKNLEELLRGLKYLHSANILHRDLKPGNLLINANCDLKICDFGLARTSNGQGQFMTEYVVTRWYRAPELLLCCDNYGTSIDVWSVGCIFAELLGRKPIFPGSECLNQLKLIVNALGTMNDSDLSFIDNAKARKYIKSLPYTPGISFSSLYPHADPLAIDLLQKMLVFDPSRRISVIEALQHPYMSPLYDPSSNPPADVPVDIEVDEDLGEEMIREMMWNEMHYYHPDESSLNVSDIVE